MRFDGKLRASAMTALLIAATLGQSPGSAGAEERYGLGRVASEAEIAPWNIEVRPDGSGLPLGQGTVAEGERLFHDRCEGCHQAGGTKPPGPGLDVLVGGKGTVGTAKPLRTIGSYWPYATTLFDYIRRAMPFDAPRSLTSDEIYAVVAYLLNANGVIAADVSLDRDSLPKVALPYRDGFIDRDDWRTPATAKP